MTQYFKRYKMVVSAQRASLSQSVPLGYHLVPWEDHLLEAHALAKYESFRSELDSVVFPCLGEEAGCRRLMGEIKAKPGFVPQATRLAICRKDGEMQYCGTVQGIVDQYGHGGIQNLGVVPGHRGNGLGKCLLNHALAGFRRVAVGSVYLEVTAKNTSAIRLYRNLGFRHVKTVFKPVEIAMT